MRHTGNDANTENIAIKIIPDYLKVVDFIEEMEGLE